MEPMESRQYCSVSPLSETKASMLSLGAIEGTWKGHSIELTIGPVKWYLPDDILLHIDVAVATNIDVSDAQISQLRHGHLHFHVKKKIRVASSNPEGRLVTQNLDYNINMGKGGKTITGSVVGVLDGHSINTKLSLKKTSNSAPTWAI
jgi:hypothetical protein